MYNEHGRQDMYIMYHNECLQKLDTSGEMRGMQYLA